MARRTTKPPKLPLNHDPLAVAAALEEAEITMTELAARCGVSVSLISEIIGGTRNATSRFLPVLARELGCPKEQLKRKPSAQAAAQTAATK